MGGEGVKFMDTGRQVLKTGLVEDARHQGPAGHSARRHQRAGHLHGLHAAVEVLVRRRRHGSAPPPLWLSGICPPIYYRHVITFSLAPSAT